jgi:hypothetical protein
MILLLAFSFTSHKCISLRAADTDITSISADELIIPATAENAIVSTEAVYRIQPSAADDEVIAYGAGQCPCAGDKVREKQACASRRLEIIDIDR